MLNENGHLVVKVKRLDDRAKLPTKAHATDSGFDLFALEEYIIPARSHLKTRSGVAFELPPGYEMQVRSRSGLAGKGIVAFHGTVDNEYRGEVAAIMYNHTDEDYVVHRGDRLCQLVIKPVPTVNMVEADQLTETTRGTCGFGSTGR